MYISHLMFQVCLSCCQIAMTSNTGHKCRTGYFDWDVCHTVICTKTPQSLFVVQQ